MLVQKWRRIESLFHEALAKSADERSTFLDRACSSDHTLRREIESLLEHENLARRFLESDGFGAPPVAATREPVHAGKQIGPYTVLEPLGAGGMGEVYKAHDQRLDRHVAIKFLSHRLVDDAASLHRFEQEARAASALNHPNICTVHDVGEYQRRPFLVMELMEGQSLKDRIGKSPLAAGELASIARQICAALQAAHEKSIVHRDIKPANIFVTNGGQVKVLDFGLAKCGAELTAPGPQENGSTQRTGPGRWASIRRGNSALPAAGLRCARVPGESFSNTVTGTILGTLAYMSPEQAVGEEVDARSDIFSLGVVLYEAATGWPPFRGKTPAGILGSILTELPAKPSSVNIAVSPSLDRVILKALEKNAANRYAAAAELSTDLDRCLKQGHARRAAWMATAAVAVAIAAGFAGTRLGWFATGSRAELTPRQVTANPPEDPVMEASLSPDGKTVAYGDFAGLHLRRIDTRETRLIPPPEDYCFR